MGGGISAPPPTHPGLCFAPPIPCFDPVGGTGKKTTRIAGEGVYAIGASVMVGTVRGHGHFENLGRLLRLPGFRKIFRPNASVYIKS